MDKLYNLTDEEIGIIEGKMISEVIIVPLNDAKEEDIKNFQITSMARTWNNTEDEAWNEL